MRPKGQKFIIQFWGQVHGADGYSESTEYMPALVFPITFKLNLLVTLDIKAKMCEPKSGDIYYWQHPERLFNHYSLLWMETACSLTFKIIHCGELVKSSKCKHISVVIRGYHQYTQNTISKLIFFFWNNLLLLKIILSSQIVK